MGSLSAPVRRPAALTPLTGTLAAGTLLLPWLTTGSTRRSALGVIHALRAAGLMSRGPAQVFFVAIALVPGVAAATWLLHFTGYRRVAAGTTAIAGALCSVSALTVRHVAHHRAATGTVFAVAFGIVAVVLGLASLLTPTRKALTS
jgi:hypothetical protein